MEKCAAGEAKFGVLGDAYSSKPYSVGLVTYQNPLGNLSRLGSENLPKVVNPTFCVTTPLSN